MNTLASPACDRRLPLLDGLRGIAAVGVMLYHAEGLFPALAGFSRMYLFVDLFFLLSGFVLGLAAEPKMHAGQGWVSFMRARWKRLWPMIGFAVLIGAVPFALVNSTQAVAISALFAILLLPNIAMPNAPYAINTPLWSLAMEVIANALHAALLWRLTTRALLLLSVISGLVLAVLIFVQGTNNFHRDEFNWPLALSRVIFAYTLGLVVARGHFARLAAVGARKDWCGAVVFPLTLLVALPLLPLSHAMGDALVTLILLPAGFYWATRCALPKVWNGPAQSLGAISYPLYAVHMPLLVLVAQWRNDGIGLLISLTLALSVAAMLARIFEQRGQQRKSAQKETAAPA